MQPSLENMTPEKWQQLKARARARDRQRIANGEATPEEIQRENTIFTPEIMSKMKIDLTSHIKATKSIYSDEDIDAMCEPQT